MNNHSLKDRFHFRKKSSVLIFYHLNAYMRYFIEQRRTSGNPGFCHRVNRISRLFLVPFFVPPVYFLLFTRFYSILCTCTSHHRFYKRPPFLVKLPPPVLSDCVESVLTLREPAFHLYLHIQPYSISAVEIIFASLHYLNERYAGKYATENAPLGYNCPYYVLSLRAANPLPLLTQRENGKSNGGGDLHAFLRSVVPIVLATFGQLH